MHLLSYKELILHTESQFIRSVRFPIKPVHRDPTYFSTSDFFQSYLLEWFNPLQKNIWVM